jgi:integrase
VEVWIARGPGGKPERWGRTQAEAIRRLAEAGPPGPDVTVGQWADRWLAGLSVKPATRKGYNWSLSHIRPHLGSVRLRDLTPTRVERFAADLAREGLSPNSIKKAVNELQVMLGGAVRDGVIDRNPAQLARKPRGERKKIHPFTPAELADIISLSCQSVAWAPLALLAATGCRQGEALALDVSDVDFAAGTVSITKTFDRRCGIGTPKSANGVRTIRVPAPALPALELAAGGRKAGPLFESGHGNRRSRDILQKAWLRVLKRLKLKRRNLHQLRHTFATLSIANGYGVGDVAKYIGDAPATVYLTYCHPSGQDPSLGMERLLSPGQPRRADRGQ